MVNSGEQPKLQRILSSKDLPAWTFFIFEMKEGRSQAWETKKHSLTGSTVVIKQCEFFIYE